MNNDNRNLTSRKLVATPAYQAAAASEAPSGLARAVIGGPIRGMPQGDTAPLIRARGLTKRFAALTAVDAVDFDVAAGEAFGFLGPNGAGKTSTMRMIGCVSPRAGGELTVLGLGPETQGPGIRARPRGGAPEGRPARPAGGPASCSSPCS